MYDDGALSEDTDEINVTEDESNSEKWIEDAIKGLPKSDKYKASMLGDLLLSNKDIRWNRYGDIVRPRTIKNIHLKDLFKILYSKKGKKGSESEIDSVKIIMQPVLQPAIDYITNKKIIDRLT